jgi:hypothetical protein
MNATNQPITCCVSDTNNYQFNLNRFILDYDEDFDFPEIEIDFNNSSFTTNVNGLSDDSTYTTIVQLDKTSSDPVDYESTYTTNNPAFEMLFKPDYDNYFESNQHLEMLDEHLSEKYYESLTTPSERFKSTRDDGIHERTMSDKDFNEFAESHKLTKTQAFEILRRCHCCGSKDIKFGEFYCNYLCRLNCRFNKHACFWNKECVLCPKSEEFTLIAGCIKVFPSYS